MVQKTKQVFRDQKITIVADTGYYNYLEIIDVVDKSTELLIKPQKGKKDKVASGFDKENFKYDAINDRYTCPSAKGGRSVTRLNDEKVIEQIAENTRRQSNIYKQRAAIVEHPFGTMKRHLGAHTSLWRPSSFEN